jgi:hypothetical protein
LHDEITATIFRERCSEVIDLPICIHVDSGIQNERAAIGSTKKKACGSRMNDTLDCFSIDESLIYRYTGTGYVRRKE